MQPYNNALQIQRVGVLDFVHHEGGEDGAGGTLQAGGLLELQIQVTDDVLQGLEGSGTLLGGMSKVGDSFAKGWFLGRQPFAVNWPYSALRCILCVKGWRPKNQPLTKTLFRTVDTARRGTN